MAYQLQEINRRIQTDVQEFLAECDDNYAQRVSLAADKILTNLEHSPITARSPASSCSPDPPAPERPPPP